MLVRINFGIRAVADHLGAVIIAGVFAPDERMVDAHVVRRALKIVGREHVS